MNTAFKDGLEDVIAARSAICAIDGAAGRLYYRGYEIGELAGTVPFEDVTLLLWRGELPTATEAAEFRARLQGERGLPAPVVERLNGEINKALATPELRARLAGEALDPMPMSPAEFGRYMQDDIAKWAKLAKARDIHLTD